MSGKSKKDILILGIVILLFISIIVYLMFPSKKIHFSKPEPYQITNADLKEFETIASQTTLYSTENDSYDVRYCEADFDGDGVRDRAMANGLETDILFNIGTGNERKIVQDQIGSSGFTSISCVDMNRDGKIDLLLGDYGDQCIDILYNNGKGDFILSVIWKRSDRVMLDPNGTDFIVKDVNHDEWTDIIYKTKTGDYYLLRNLGDSL